MTQLTDRKVLVLVSNGVDEAVMSNILRDLNKEGASVKTVAAENGFVNSWNNATNAWGLYFPVDQNIGQTLGADFDALIVPAGARSVAKLSTNAHAERIISSFITACKPMVFVGDAVELLAKTGLATGWNVTGPVRSQQIMVGAGAVWETAPQCQHGILLTGEGEGADTATFMPAAVAHMVGAVTVEENVKVAA